MKYRALGRRGFQVSDIAVGLWGMGGWTGSDDQESLKSLQLAVDSGCNFFDTAWAYGNGKSDALLGEILTRNKFRNAKNMPLYAASKIPPKNDTWPATPEFKYRDVFPAKHVFEYAKKTAKNFARIPSMSCNSTFGTIAGPTSLSSAKPSRNSKPTNGFAPSASA